MNALSRYSIVTLVAVAMGVPGLSSALAVAPTAGQAPASTAPAEEPRVTVTYLNPENFSEAREFGQENRFNRVNYLDPLKAHLIRQATRMLPPGNRLEVTITDIKLAGGYEPWHDPRLMHVRFMKDIYPPRIDLTFKLLDSDGKVLREGSRKLRNLGYLHSGVARGSDTDPRRYDKALIDSWLRRGPDNL